MRPPLKSNTYGNLLAQAFPEIVIGKGTGSRIGFPKAQFSKAEHYQMLTYLPRGY